MIFKEIKIRLWLHDFINTTCRLIIYVRIISYVSNLTRLGVLPWGVFVIKLSLSNFVFVFFAYFLFAGVIININAFDVVLFHGNNLGVYETLLSSISLLQFYFNIMKRRSSIALESFCNLYTNHLRQEWNSLPPLRQASVTISMTDEKRLEFSVTHFRQLWSYLFLWVFPQGTPQCLLCLNYVWQWRSDQLGKFCTLWTDIQKLVESNLQYESQIVCTSLLAPVTTT